VGTRVLIMGTGAIGGSFGAPLALHGHDVTFVARGAQLEAMQERGLEVRSGGETHVLRPVSAVGRPVEAGGYFDLVLFAVKGYDTEDAALALRPVVGSQTTVLTVQNGIESADRLAAILGPSSILAGVAYVVASVIAPGVIDQTSAFRRIVFGEPEGGSSSRVETIATSLRDAGVGTIVAPDTRTAVWQKFVMQSPNATISSVCQAPVGAIRDTPDGAALYRRAIGEVASVGRASGVALAEDAEATAFAMIGTMPRGGKTSMQVDFERGRRVEVEELTGAVVRRGLAVGVPTPIFDTLYAILKVQVQMNDLPT
jgi:2-dehydropantoate 2-reductase